MELSQLANEFSTVNMQRATRYALSGKVEVTEFAPNLVKAIVHGGAPYDVGLRIARNRLWLSCDCPAFHRQGPCKHLWATLIVAEQRGILRQLSPFSRVESADEDDDIEEGVPSVGGAPPRGFTGTPSTSDSVPESRYAPRAALPSKFSEPMPEWKALLNSARSVPSTPETHGHPADSEVVYIVDAERTMSGSLVVLVQERSLKKKGGFTRPHAVMIPVDGLTSLPDPRDRHVLPLLQAASTLSSSASPPTLYEGPYRYVRCFSNQVSLPLTMADTVMPALAATHRLFVRPPGQLDLVPAIWDGDSPWEFQLRMRRRDDGQGADVTGMLRRGDDVVDLTAPLVCTLEGWVLFPDRVARLQHFGAFGLVGLLRKEQTIVVPTGDEQDFIATLLSQPTLPLLDLPPELAPREIAVIPTPELRIAAGDKDLFRGGTPRFTAALSFTYEGRSIAADDPRTIVAFAEEPSESISTGGPTDESRLAVRVHRNPEAELAARNRLSDVGFRIELRSFSHSSFSHSSFSHSSSNDRQAGVPVLTIASAALPAAVQTLITEGWFVETEGKLQRAAGRFSLSVTSGIDWFDLNVTADFGGVTAPLPALLRALHKGQRSVVLSDGSVGLLPEEWLKKFGSFTGLGQVEGESLRFRHSQAGLLDALLATQPDVFVDDLFVRARDELADFDGVAPEAAPLGFTGQLRPYQEAGLGWLSFLRRFGFGGCLADDMGLGKTIQVLAMLESRRSVAKIPSLVVVPKSLVWNWGQEAARFVPDLRVRFHTGPERVRDASQLGDVDLIVTTYGTLRADAPWLSQMDFDYLILDEAQAIKNAGSESAKAARLLHGRHRLALSGTPVENHIGELWSLFEFLNPGMLGSARAFEGATKRGRPSPETMTVLSTALRPFILRRTKDRVAPELPAKHEETIQCELEPRQRKLYDELRDHYRASLLGRVDREGIGKAKIQVLEALLRLRQAACHPGLIDKKRVGESSAKLDVLLPRLEEVRAEGHKAIVFSQFTSFLDILRARLDEQKIPYAYIDGKVSSAQRAARVTQFQEDSSCPFFLISLKAGGTGLNLTAAEYVFILDPWWNPAVEAQAGDRAHRIGQDKRVFVYRLLCAGTVEEKVAALQESKRSLVESILTTSESLIRDLDRQTLEMLLS